MPSRPLAQEWADVRRDFGRLNAIGLVSKLVTRMLCQELLLRLHANVAEIVSPILFVILTIFPCKIVLMPRLNWNVVNIVSSDVTHSGGLIGCAFDIGNWVGRKFLVERDESFAVRGRSLLLMLFSYFSEVRMNIVMTVLLIIECKLLALRYLIFLNLLICVTFLEYLLL